MLTRREMIEREQIVANELILEFDQQGLGRVRQARPAARFSEIPADIQGFAPILGEHTREILIAHGYSSHRIDNLMQTNVVR